MYHDGVWGTVCDNGWDINDATVVCQQLGFQYGAAQSLSGAPFGEGDGQIWLENLMCTGFEIRLDDCRHNGWGNHYCGHGEDVGVNCFEEGML